MSVCHASRSSSVGNEPSGLVGMLFGYFSRPSPRHSVSPKLVSDKSVVPLMLPTSFTFFFYLNQIPLFYFVLQTVQFPSISSFFSTTTHLNRFQSVLFIFLFTIRSFTSVNQINVLCLNLCWVSNDHLFYNACSAIGIRLLNLFHLFNHDIGYAISRLVLLTASVFVFVRRFLDLISLVLDPNT